MRLSFCCLSANSRVAPIYLKSGWKLTLVDNYIRKKKRRRMSTVEWTPSLFECHRIVSHKSNAMILSWTIGWIVEYSYNPLHRLRHQTNVERREKKNEGNTHWSSWCICRRTWTKMKCEQFANEMIYLSFAYFTWRYGLWTIISFIITWREDKFTSRCSPKNSFIMFNELENRSISNGFSLSHVCSNDKHNQMKWNEFLLSNGSQLFKKKHKSFVQCLTLMRNSN